MTLTPRRIKRGWMNLRVSKIDHENHDTRTIWLEDADEGGRQFDYTPGQYLTFRFDALGAKPLVRSYTMSSSPCQPDAVAITVKVVPHGTVSHFLCDQLHIGTILRARGAIGRFCYEKDKDQPHLVMFGAGSGVTPFVSMLREYAPYLGQSQDVPRQMTLLASFRSRQDLICWNALEEAGKHPGVRVVTTLTRETVDEFWHGRLDAAMVDRLLEAIDPPVSACTFMACGPQEMMDIAFDHLRERGVPETSLKAESFAN